MLMLFFVVLVVDTWTSRREFQSLSTWTLMVYRYCGSLLWFIIVDYYCGLLLWIIIVDY